VGALEGNELPRVAVGALEGKKATMGWNSHPSFQFSPISILVDQVHYLHSWWEVAKVRGLLIESISKGEVC